MNNMITKQAIEKATEGGWKLRGIPILRVETHEMGGFVRLFWRGGQYSKNGEEYSEVEPEVIALDPLFWQALGKALGWEGDIQQPQKWRNKAIYFYDLILTGGSTDKFWQEILQ